MKHNTNNKAQGTCRRVADRVKQMAGRSTKGAGLRLIRFAGLGVALLFLGICAPIYANQQQDQGKQGQPRAQQQGQGQQRQQHTQQQQHQGRQDQHRVQQQQQGQVQRQQHTQQQQHQGRQDQHRVQQQQQGQHQPDQRRIQQQQQGQRQQDQYRAQRGQGQPDQHRVQQQQQGHRQPEQYRAQQQYQGRRVQQSEQRGVWDRHRAERWEAEHRTWQQRGGYYGYRIPEAHFHRHFGRDHWFRIHSLPVYVVGGYPRFLFGGFWFSLVDPWPEYWADDWYQTDDVYIDYYGDGYYLYNRRHPGVRIAINVFVG